VLFPTRKKKVFLNKVLKCNLHYKKKSWIQTLALEAKIAISQLQLTDHDHVQHLVARNIKDLTKQNNSQKENSQKQDGSSRTSYNVQNKKEIGKQPHYNYKTSKGNILVIIYEQHYINKTEEIIKSNTCETITTDIIEKSQKQIRHSLNSCNIIKNKDTKWRYISKNPANPTIHRLMELHKHNYPICPTIN
jgi:hypothetical protein